MNDFNIRVYGIFINDNNEVLVSDEFRLGIPMTKFPGGGLEFGEGTVDCLKRECEEELGQAIRVLSHFYTTDFFQLTELLTSPQQLISIYYRMETAEAPVFQTSDRKQDLSAKDGEQKFRWVALDTIDPAEFTFPVDRKVAAMLRFSS